MSRRLLILCACPFPVPQGSQVFLRDHARALARRGHSVKLLVYGHGLPDLDWPMHGVEILRAPRMPGRNTHAGPFPAKPLHDAALLFALRTALRRFRPHAVLAHNYEALALALATRARPLIYHAHNAMADELPAYFKNTAWPRYFGAWLDKNLPRRADKVIVPHAPLRDYLRDCGVPPQRLHLIPPPVFTEEFPCAPPAPQAMPPVLYTGNLDAYQDLGILFAAMNRIRAQFPQARLQIATAAPNIAIPEAEIAHTPDLHSLLHLLAHDCIVAIPRRSWSGYPVKMLNAMAAARPVVALPACAHALRHDHTGWIARDNTAEALADGLLALLADAPLRRRLGTAARRAIEDDHAPEKIAAEIESAIEDAIRTASPSHAD